MTDLLVFFCYSVFPFIQSCFTPSSFLGLPQFGVIPFEIRTLMYCHTEQRRTQRFYIAAIVRHRGTVGAWRNRGDLRDFINIFCLLHYKTFVLQDFLKRFLQSYQQHVHYGSVALCAFGTSVILSLCFHLWVLLCSVCL